MYLFSHLAHLDSSFISHHQPLVLRLPSGTFYSVPFKVHEDMLPSLQVPPSPSQLSRSHAFGFHEKTETLWSNCWSSLLHSDVSLLCYQFQSEVDVSVDRASLSAWTLDFLLSLSLRWFLSGFQTCTQANFYCLSPVSFVAIVHICRLCFPPLGTLHPHWLPLLGSTQAYPCRSKVPLQWSSASHSSLSTLEWWVL